MFNRRRNGKPFEGFRLSVYWLLSLVDLRSRPRVDSRMPGIVVPRTTTLSCRSMYGSMPGNRCPMSTYFLGGITLEESNGIICTHAISFTSGHAPMS